MDEPREPSAAASEQPLRSLEDDVVPCEWTDKDYDIVAEYVLNRDLLHLPNVSELDWPQPV